MIININPNSFTDISTGSCTISSNYNTQLVRIYEGDKFILESYLNKSITILTDMGLKAKSFNNIIDINVELL